MARNRSTWGRTEKLDVTPEPISEEEEVTQPHALRYQDKSHESQATVEDLNEAFTTLWERVSNLKVASVRSKRVTDKQMSSERQMILNLNWKMKIVWAVGTLILAGTVANLYAGINYIYGKGGSDAEAKITQRTLVESVAEQGKRLRVAEDALITLSTSWTSTVKTIQRIEDLLSRRFRYDISPGRDNTGAKND